MLLDVLFSFLPKAREGKSFVYTYELSKSEKGGGTKYRLNYGHVRTRVVITVIYNLRPEGAG